MHIPWDDVNLFLAVAESKSLSAAALRLQITQPTVSRRVADLEARVGEALFARSATGAALTPLGESLVEPARRMAEWAAEVDRVAQRADASPRGEVRITAPPGVAFDFVAPFAGWAKERLPDIQFTVLAKTEYLDLSRGGADLALRFAAPVQRDVVTLATVEIEIAAFGSAEYARTLPRKAKPSDVAWIAWAPPFDQLSPNPELARLIPSFRPAFASDDYLVQLRAAEAGLGAMFLGLVNHRFSRSPLVQLDVALPVMKRSLYLACAKRALDIPRTRAVADLLVEELGKLQRKQGKSATHAKRARSAG